MSRPVNHFYDFGGYRVDPIKRRLLRDGEVIPLAPKVFDTLLLLVEQRGRTVERDELMAEVWQDVIVEENNLTQNISTLRKILGDGNSNGQYIVTIPKQGYRFVAEVKEVLAEAEKLPVEDSGQSPLDLETISEQGEARKLATLGTEAKAEASTTASATGIRSTIKRHKLLAALALAVLLISTIALGWYVYKPRNVVVGEKKSIAVLPLKPINAATRDELYEIGIADSLILRLSSLSGLVVRPLTATRHYTDIKQDPIAAGKEQKVDYVLASNYQVADGKIRITAQLFNVASGEVEETYKSEKAAGDLFGMQDAIANEVGNKLQARFATMSTNVAAKRGTTNEEAYRLYLHGKNLTAQRSLADAKKAIEYFEQAIRLDPNFALAYAGMAHAYRASGSLGGSAPGDQFEKATAAVNKALELDNTLAEAYAVRGDLHQKYAKNWAAAEKDLLRAIELESNNDLAHYLYAELLADSGHFDEAMAEIEIALTIDPRSLVYQRNRGRILYFSRRYDEAIVQLKRVIELDENFNTAYDWLWMAHEMKGDYGGAYEWFMKNQKRRSPDNVELFQTAYKTAGWQGVKQKQLEIEKQIENQPSGSYFRIARFCSLLGDKEQAFAYLNKAIEQRQSQPVMLKVDPIFDSLRGDPRFAELLKRVGFK